MVAPSGFAPGIADGRVVFLRSSNEGPRHTVMMHIPDGKAPWSQCYAQMRTGLIRLFLAIARGRVMAQWPWCPHDNSSHYSRVLFFMQTGRPTLSEALVLGKT